MAESAYRDRIMSDNLGVQHRLRTMHTACLPARMRMLDVEKLNQVSPLFSSVLGVCFLGDYVAFFLQKIKTNLNQI